MSVSAQSCVDLSEQNKKYSSNVDCNGNKSSNEAPGDVGDRHSGVTVP